MFPRVPFVTDLPRSGVPASSTRRAALGGGGPGTAARGLLRGAGGRRRAAARPLAPPFPAPLRRPPRGGAAGAGAGRRGRGRAPMERGQRGLCNATGSGNAAGSAAAAPGTAEAGVPVRREKAAGSQPTAAVPLPAGVCHSCNARERDSRSRPWGGGAVSLFAEPCLSLNFSDQIEICAKRWN